MSRKIGFIVGSVVKVVGLQLSVGEKNYPSPMLLIERLGKLDLLRRKRAQLCKQYEHIESIMGKCIRDRPQVLKVLCINGAAIPSLRCALPPIFALTQDDDSSLWGRAELQSMQNQPRTVREYTTRFFGNQIQRGLI